MSNTAIEVLKKASHAELEPLVRYLDIPFDVRIKRDPRYLQHADDLTKIPEVIDEHLRRAGGHSLRNVIRGEGPPYREVVIDVCKRAGVPVRDEAEASELEISLLKKLSGDKWATMSLAERRRFPDDAAKRIERKAKRKAWIPYVLGGALVGGALVGGALAANQLAGPSMSATVRCVLYIAILRMRQSIDYALGERDDDNAL